MRRMAAICFAWSMLALGIAHAVPARPLYEPPAPATPPKVTFIDLKGTAWAGKYGVTNRIYIFEADGSISYSSTGKTVFKIRGNWKFDGINLFFDHHTGTKKISYEFRGIVKDANTIVGEQTLVTTGAKSPATMTRTVMPGK